MSHSTHLVAARELISPLAEGALAAERNGCLPLDTVRRLQAAGLPQMLQPPPFGGAPSSVGDYVDVCATLAHGCVSTAWCNFVWGIHSFLIGLFPASTQTWLWEETPSMLVSASLGPVGRARVEPQGLRVAGCWGFASGCDHAGALLLGVMSPDGPWLCVMPKADYEIVDNWQVAGLKGTGSKDIVIHDGFVPHGRALPFTQCIDPNRGLLTLVIAGPVLGAGEAAVQEYRELIGVTPDQASKQRLAYADAQVRAARLLLVNGCAEIDAALAAKTTLAPGVQLRISRDTAFAADLVSQAVNRVFAAASGRTLHESATLQRLWRDVAAGCSHARLRWDAPAEAYAQHLIEQERS
ncbi:MAG: 3-hydroxy-9,10-secoandrosta-1,3,5(10)-triene-9,17-dione monooxygenase [Gammaproteobacteria bacterium]|jgi:3-hydroxy-9,10-secoandrosta-1,3,5(10)-triene-9,17-dione monooxygenase